LLYLPATQEKKLIEEHGELYLHATQEKKLIEEHGEIN
jgi:hypothetical protein